MVKIAVFEKVGNNKKLIGFKTKAKPTQDDVVVPDDCDLAVDGRYKYNEEQKRFEPFGHNFKKPKKPKYPKERVFYLFMKAVIDSKSVEIMPYECTEWVKWYEDNLKKREEEEQMLWRTN